MARCEESSLPESIPAASSEKRREGKTGKEKRLPSLPGRRCTQRVKTTAQAQAFRKDARVEKEEGPEASGPRLSSNRSVPRRIRAV